MKEKMRNEEIAKIKEVILETLGGACEKIVLFGSYAYGEPREESDIDIYIVLKDGSKKPVLALEDVYAALGKNERYEPVDVLANYTSRFEFLRSRLLNGLSRTEELFSMADKYLLADWVRHATTGQYHGIQMNLSLMRQ
jgi:predicted nucleotidyltransferase